MSEPTDCFSEVDKYATYGDEMPIDDDDPERAIRIASQQIAESLRALLVNNKNPLGFKPELIKWIFQLRPKKT